jgi:PAS domain S-box-containing protein
MSDLGIFEAEQQRRLLQEYIFDLEEAKDHAAELEAVHENLKKYQDLLVAVLTCTIHGLCIVKERRVVWCNLPLTDILGWKHEELIGQSTRILYPSATDFDRIGKFFYEGLQESDFRSFEYELCHKDGRRVPCLVTGRALDPRDHSKGFVFSITDYTDRHRSRKALEDACGELENRTAELTAANRRLQREIEEREAVQRELHGYRNHLEELVEERTRELTAVNARLRREMAERQRIEEELLKTQKLESLGILAGGIAHDFNNILTAVIGNISLVKASDSLEYIHQRSGEMEKACFRARNLTLQLLTFAKGGQPVKKTASISELLRDCTVFALSGSDVQADFDLPEDLWPVEVDEGQISQVINNLVLNAQQAMPAGGTVKIGAKNVKIGVNSDLSLAPGRYVQVSFIDQGCGIGPEQLSKVFDPYFTTKEVGSGLGLTSAYSIVRKHDGHIRVESDAGRGAAFHVYLPASRRKPLLQPQEEERIILGEGRILVLDDEAAVRAVLRRMLAKLGYEADFAANGEEAMEIFARKRASGEEFAALILDLTIPGGMGGKTVLEKLLKIDPQVKAIVSSGYSEDPIMAQFQEYGFRGVIAKPYKIAELSEILHRVITA